jgi:thioredoxin reductase (NADPH)
MTFHVLIIGGGPAGLAAAIAAKSRALTCLVLEKGALVNSLLRFPTGMVFFTTPELLEIGKVPFVSPNEKPTRLESLRYYRRAADTFDIDIVLSEPVSALAVGADGHFTVVSQPPHGAPVTRKARAVVIATGAYDIPNMIGIPGEDLPHVSHFYTEPHPYYRKRVVVVGGRNSAAETALDLFRSGSHPMIVHRQETLADSIKYWVRPDIDNRIKEGSIPARFSTRVLEITPTDVLLEGPAGRVREPADAVLLMTGYSTDTALLRMVGASIDEATGAPVHHPETFETTVRNLFLAGACVAGRQSGRIFIENGRFHGEVVIGEIAQRTGAPRS